MSSEGGGGGDDWCTIESDPAVFTELLETLGVRGVELQELWSLDDDSLAQLRSESDVYALIFLFEWNQDNKTKRSAAASAAEGGGGAADGSTASAGGRPLSEAEIPPGLFFAQQVATNACATQAILSALFNRVPPDQWGPVLHEFNSFTADFPPHLRGVAISGSQEIRVAHNSFRRPDAFLNEEKVVKDEAGGEAFHFVAYLPYKSKVYELDGLQPGPIEIGSARGLAGPGDDSMEEEGRGGGDGGGDQEDEDDDEGWLAVARAAIQDRMDREATEHVKYNLMAVVQDKRVPLQRSLEADPSNEAAAARLADEEAKRERWRLDNQRRRHNFVPLVVEMLKSLAVKDGMLARLAAEGQERAAARKDAAKASQKNK